MDPLSSRDRLCHPGDELPVNQFECLRAYKGCPRHQERRDVAQEARVAELGRHVFPEHCLADVVALRAHVVLKDVLHAPSIGFPIGQP